MNSKIKPLFKFLWAILLFSLPILNLPAQDYRPFIESQYKKQTYAPGSSDLSQGYSFIGMYKEALLEEEKNGIPSEFQLVKSDVDKKLHAENAYPFIYEAIRKNKIVVMNEAHNIPLTRVTLYTMIDNLKKLGVDALFLEALQYSATDSIYRNFNPENGMGYYAVENVFRQVMYKLKQAGIPLYSYEEEFERLDTATIQGKKYFISKKDKQWIPIPTDDYLLANYVSPHDFYNREVEQALKIYQKLLRNKINKALIFCGYDHGRREGNNMIDNLEHLLKKRVFAIDQVLLNERINRNLEDTLYTQFATASYPFVIVNHQKKPLHTLRSITKSTITDSLCDLFIGSPRSNYIQNRPTWLELNGYRKRYPLSQFMDTTQLYSDFLVCVYRAEVMQTKKDYYIPDDVFQVLGNGKEYDLLLDPHTNYQLKIIKDGQLIIDKPIPRRIVRCATVNEKNESSGF